MKHNEVIRSVSWMTKVKIKDIANKIGVSYSALTGSLSEGGAPSVTRFVDCIEACGYKVVVMRNDEPLPQYSIRVDGSKGKNVSK